MNLNEIKEKLGIARQLSFENQNEQSLEILRVIHDGYISKLDDELKADINYLMASNRFYLGFEKEAIQHLVIAYEIYKNRKDYFKWASTCNNIGALYKRIGNLERSMLYYLQALQLSMKIEEDKIVVNCMMNIANVLCTIKDYPRALQALDAAITICFGKKDNPEFEVYKSKVQGTKAMVLGITERYEEAINLFEETIPVLRQYGDKLTIHIHKSNIAKCLIKLGRPEEALLILKSYERKRKAAGAYHSILDYMNLAEINKLYTKDEKTFLFYLNQAKTLAKKNGLIPTVIEIHQILCDHYKENGNIALAQNHKEQGEALEARTSNHLDDFLKFLDTTLPLLERKSMSSSAMLVLNDYLHGLYRFRKDGVSFAIPYASIVYCEIQGNNLLIYCSLQHYYKEGAILSCLKFRKTITVFESEMNRVSDHFVRIHDKYIVNINHIYFDVSDSYSKIRIGSKVLNISSKYRSTFKALHENYTSFLS